MRADRVVLRPGARLGILGGGQLGRMLAMAALKLGLRCHIYAPEAEAPAYEAARHHTIAAYDDEAALARFADGCDLITYEFENVPLACVEFLQELRPVYPQPRALAVTQDRLYEKQFLQSLGLETAPFCDVADATSLAAALAEIGYPAILKTRHFGYDGKGQVKIEAATDLAVLDVGGMIVEGVVPFEREVSIIAARNAAGEIAAYDLCENEHENHILARTCVPANVPPGLERQAREIAEAVLCALDYVGVMCIEMFVVGDRLVVNEMAPRVHNSGHWTIEGAVTSQFEQHVRVIAGWPLGSTLRLGTIEMRNVIGGAAEAWRDNLAQPGWSVHLYGKSQARPGRKMGHMTRVILCDGVNIQ